MPNPPDQTTAPETKPPRRKLTAREVRMLCYLLVVLVVAAWKFLPRPWHPTITLETPHHIIYSTATPQQTEDTAHAMGLLYNAYSNRFGSLPKFDPRHHALKVKLFKDRAELRWVNPSLGWAEAFYRTPYCNAYFSAEEYNPYQWMLHEAVHQLNHEVARLELEKWLDEGTAEYFSTSRLQGDKLAVGRIDLNTYPVWWIDDLATSPDLAENIRNGSVIPLRFIITDQGGPSMHSHFNLYYLHWWTLTYFIFESPRYHDRALELVKRGGGIDAFQQVIGPVELVQTEWHSYVRQLKDALSGKDLEVLKSRKLRDHANGPAGTFDQNNRKKAQET
jgi:hypothetical protein